MKIIIAGATGLIGEALVKRLTGKHELIIFTRDVPAARKKFFGKGIHFADWHQPPSHLAALIDGSRALINLAGAGIGDKRWSYKRKEAILWSRVQTVETLHKLLKAAEIQLDVVIQASATGYYGSEAETSCSEDAAVGTGFLAEVTYKWEKAAAGLEEVTKRLVLIRSGVVLSDLGGALPKMALPFRLMAGGRMGSGKQWISWIDLDDEIEAILFLLHNNQCAGIYNLVSPKPVMQNDFAKTLGKVLRRPAIVPTPAFAVRLALGEMGNELLLKGAKVVPQRLLDEGFKFQFTTLEQSLSDKLG